MKVTKEMSSFEPSKTVLLGKVDRCQEDKNDDRFDLN